MITAFGISNKVPTLEGIGITLKPGQITGIIGPNGAGKTTLLKMLAGLLKPESGKIELDQSPLLKMPISERALRIAYLEQHSFVHWPLSVHQLIELGRFPHRINPNNCAAIDNEVMDKVVDQVGIGPLLDRQFNSLSGGERARVIIARALAVQADHLLVDEPIASLDLKFQIEVMNLLAIQAQNNTVVCVILHDLNLAAAYCQSLYLLDKGKLASSGCADEVLTQENILSTFGVDTKVTNNNGQIEINPVLSRSI